MKRTLFALATALTLAASASADPYYWSGPAAPDACGPGIYMVDCYGCVRGPYYCVRPPWDPFNGARPALGGGGAGGAGGPATLIFPTHPFARSPRDFFMLEENRPYQR